MKAQIQIITFSILLLLINSCKSIRDKPNGKWKLVSVINSDDIYAQRSSLEEIKIISEKEIIIKGDSTFTSNLNLCNEWQPKPDYISKGIYHFKKTNPDKLFWLECKGIYPDHYFKLNGKKLELYNPSVTGYRIQIFEKSK